MPTKKEEKAQIPADYQRLEGSERRPSPKAKLLGPADPKEIFSVTIVLRRRPDGPPMPSFDYFAKTPPSQRRRLSPDEFAAKYGASPKDLQKVSEFVKGQGLTLVEAHEARRAVVVSGTVEQMSQAFAVRLGRYQHEIIRSRKSKPELQTYRGRDGFIHVPKELADIIVGVFGLDNRSITKHSSNPGDPPYVKSFTVQQIAQLYNFPTNSAAGQTIAIFSASGYFPSDLQTFFGASLPTVTPLSVNAGNLYFEAWTTSAVPAGSSTLPVATTAGLSAGWFVAGPSFQNPSTATTVSSITPTSITLSQALATGIPAGTHIYCFAWDDSGETTQDICIAGGAASGANVAVYFNTDDQAGWVGTIHRVVHPELGDPVCSVLSSSFYISGGDDAATLAAWGISTGFVEALHACFQDAAVQGVTMCMASGDTGSNSVAGKYVKSLNPLTYGGDGKAHVSYPTSDPWVLSVGGTTMGGTTNTPPPYVEYVWNDPDPTDLTQWGTTGGGVSDYFDLPSYQTKAQVPKSINDNTRVGRGVPDVAANASLNSGYQMTYFGGPSVGNGTSASSPLWAGLIALLNSNLGYNVGFINPMLYAFGSSIFNPINPLWPDPAYPQLAGCPKDNSNNGILGYPAGSGWDACTGWGSPNGTALLRAIQQGAAQDCFFIVDVGVFGQGAVQAATQGGGTAVYDDAFFVVVDGFSATQLGISSATVSNAQTNPPTVQPLFSPTPPNLALPAGMSFQLASVQPVDMAPFAASPGTPQRFTYAFNVVFTDASGFPPAPQSLAAAITATVAAGGVTVSGNATLELTSQAPPYFAGSSGISWLSADLRVFQAEAGEWVLVGVNSERCGTGIAMQNTGSPSGDATTFIQNVIQALNAGSSPTPGDFPGSDPSPDGPVASWFDLIPTGEDASALDLLPTDPANQNPVYNFAVARVRYKASMLSAQNVRVFFRLIPAASVSTAFDPTSTYRRSAIGSAIIPLFGVDSTGEVISIPCFAQPRVDASAASLTTQTDSPNVQAIQATGSEVDAYFGCWLDLNQPNENVFPANVSGSNLDGPFAVASLQTVQALLRNQHQCLVAEIAFDPNPIAVGTSPSTTGPLAQRNLSLGTAANPGAIGSRRVPNTFQVRPTSRALPPNAPADELMIDWGTTPAGSVASIYWPEAAAPEIIHLAKKMYGRNNLRQSDAHTITLPSGGISFVPIPPGIGKTMPGLITVDLPQGIRKGQRFDILVRQVANAIQSKGREELKISLTSRRRVIGSFQITIPVTTKEAMLGPEEQLLSVMRWIEKSVPAGDRWSPVFQRYVSQIADRVRGLGGNPSKILPSPTGEGQKPTPYKTEKRTALTGKIVRLIYDRFGDFEGFTLDTEDGNRRFTAREPEIEKVVNRAWEERILITVAVELDAPHRPEEIVLHCPPKPR